MAGRYVFDLESNGLLPELTKIHCIGIRNLDTGAKMSFADQPGYNGLTAPLQLLAQADLIVGHNIIGFDLPALEKVYGFKPRGLVRDTLVLTRLCWPHIKDSDFKRKNLPKNLIGSHALKAWGHRLGILKDDYAGGWEKWSPEMHSYMEQDVAVTEQLWRRIEKEMADWEVPLEDPNPPPRRDCVELEHRVAEIVERVQRHGFRFDKEKAIALVAKLTARKQVVNAELQEAFPPTQYFFTPKVNNKKLGYTKGVPVERFKVFNPGSRQQVAEHLKALGWKPTEFGADGVPTVDDDILKALPYPQAKVLAEYFLLDKRLGQIANGKQSWFKHERDGRIHGRIHAGGAHTGRMTHSNPNLAQVPKVGVPYGAECRDCFTADEGYVLVGADASGLELRDLAGYMARYDGGEYVNVVLRSDLEEEKKAGRDMHSLNALALGCTRAIAKIFFYAMIYGSGSWNLGVVLGVLGPKAKVTAAGQEAKDRLMKAVPALHKLLKAVSKAVARGYIIGLDGRRLKARSENAALNTLLQSAGAIQMKRALVTLVDNLTANEWQWGDHYAIVGLIHDEWQSNVKPQLADEFGRHAVFAIRDAGKFYNFGCPLDGEYKTGRTWKETH